MDVKQLVDALTKQKNTKSLIQEFQRYTSTSITPPKKKQHEELVVLLGLHLKNNRHKESIALFLVLMLCEPLQTLNFVRKQGTFRASKANFTSGAIRKTVDVALELAGFLKLSEKHQSYLRSTQVLLQLAAPSKALKESIVQRLGIQKDTVLKTLLVIVNEYLFKSTPGGQINVGDDAGISVEELAEAYSYILFLMENAFGKNDLRFIFTDASCWDRLESNYLPLLRDAAKLRSYVETEIRLDGLPYDIQQVENVISVFSTDDIFEKSIRVGYIHTEIQAQIKYEQFAGDYPEESAEFSVETIIDDTFKLGLGNLVQLKRSPIERYVFNIPVDDQFFSFLSNDSLFRGEYISVMSAGLDNFAQSAIQLETVTEGITVFDVIKLQRFFSFLYHTMKKKINERHSDNENIKNKLFVNSVIPVFKHESLVMLLQKIMTEKKAEKIIELLTLNDSRKLIDVQYYPFIRTGDYYVIAPSLVFKSNLLRNIIVGNSPHKRLTGQSDPMQAAVIRALKQSGFLVASEIKSNRQGAIENDITCWRDGELFVFECKNAYHPCSTKELSNSYEHIRKAGDQLDVRKQWLEVPQNQADFIRKCGIDIPFSKVVHTAVITANRLFHGYSIGAHPVRQAHELINVLTCGFIKRTDGRELRFWEDEIFQVKDLLNYLQGRSLIAMHMGSLEPYERDIQIGKFILRNKGYCLDLKKAVERAEMDFPYVDSSGPAVDN